MMVSSLIQWPRRHRKKRLCLLAAVASILAVYYCLGKWRLICSNGAIDDVIDTLCDHFANGRAHGNMCRAMCVTGSLKAESCQTFHAGKEVVFSAILNKHQRVFVKGRHTDFFAKREEALHWSGGHDGQSVVFPSKAEFEAMTRAFLANNMAIKLSPAMTADHMMDELWFPAPGSGSKKDGGNDEVRNWQRANLWSLVQDNEYVVARHFAPLDAFPRLHGTCGALYVVEALEPILYPGYFARLTFREYAKRVSVAMAILDLLDDVDGATLHLCDVKPEHFGISDAGRVKFLDLDAVFLRTYLDEAVMHNKSSCASHSDCDFFDCQGQCDVIKGVCVNGVVNNNLQVVCEKVLTSSRPPFAGLLTSKHLDKRIKRLLEVCANPSGSKDAGRLGVPADTRAELRAAMAAVLAVATKVDADQVDEDI